jgi:regulator of sigma E protease
MLDFLRAVFENQVVAFIIVVGVVVFVHEFGHFFAARAFGIFVEEFSLGFGPTACRFMWRGTEYKICWLPFGGYVRLYGQEIGAQIPLARKPEALSEAAVYKRFIVSAAGPAMNLFLTFVVMAFLAWNGIARLPSQVSVMPGSVAERAGIPDGAKILSVDGVETRTWEDLSEKIALSAGKVLRVNFEIEGVLGSVTVTPAVSDAESVYGEKIQHGRIGVTPFFQSPTVVVRSGSLLQRMGVLSGDLILSVNGLAVRHFHQVRRSVESWLSDTAVQSPLSVLVRRGEREISLSFAREQASALPSEGATLPGGVLGAVSSDMQISNSSASNSKAAGAFSTWQSCGLSAGVALAGVEGYGALNSRVQIADWVERIESASTLRMPRSEEEVFQDSRFFVIDTAGNTRIVECKTKLRRGRDHLNRERFFLDFSPKFVSESHTADPIILKSEGFIGALADGYRLSKNMGSSILDSISKLVTGRIPFSNLGGPIEIARVAGSAAKVGWAAFASMIAFISINVGLLNLLPIPILDGGTLLLLSVEAAYGRPLPVRVQEFVMRAGVFFMLLLIVLVLYNDILRRLTN